MLAIARILRTGVKLLLLDEPTEGLAPVIVQRIGERAGDARRQRGITILLVEQNFRFASRVADRFYVMEHGKVVDSFPVGELDDRMDAAPRSRSGCDAMTMIFGIPAPGFPRPAAARPDQRLVLRHAEPRPRDHLRPAARHQLRPRRAVHARRVRRLPAARQSRHRLLAGADPGAADRRAVRHRHRAAGAVAALRCSTRSMACCSPSASRCDRGRVPLLLRRLRQSLSRAAAAGRRHQSRLHVPADLSRLGGRGLARRLPRHLAADREDQARLLSARRDREPAAWCRLSASTCRCC